MREITVDKNFFFSLAVLIFAFFFAESQSRKQEMPTFIVVGLTIDSCRRVARIWKRGGGYFERVRSVQTTLTGIFIDLEAVSDGLSEN